MFVHVQILYFTSIDDILQECVLEKINPLQAASMCGLYYSRGSEGVVQCRI